MNINPPKGTKYGTRHILRNVLDNSEKEWEWTKGRKFDAWFSIGTGYGSRPASMFTVGWRYARPVEDSDNG